MAIYIPIKNDIARIFRDHHVHRFPKYYWCIIFSERLSNEKGYSSMKSYLTRIVFLACLQILLSAGVALAAEDKIAEIIRSKIEQITSQAGLQIEGAQIASATVLPEVYEENGFKRLWTNPKNVEDLYNAVAKIDEDGYWWVIGRDDDLGVGVLPFLLGHDADPVAQGNDLGIGAGFRRTKAAEYSLDQLS